MPNLEQFKLHPSVIYSLIREQAGSPEKALAELIMNSIDAGAKNVYLDISASHFSIKDDGMGFKDESEIKLFFGKFGTPHQKGDSVFGQFRLGRGQAFAIAKTEWRSGNFGMSVDLNGKTNTDVHGYSLHEFADVVEGCEIKGEFYESLHLIDGVQSGYVFDQQFAQDHQKFITRPNFSIFDGQSFYKRLVANACLVRNVNIYLNGDKISGLFSDNSRIIAETDTATYYQTKSSSGGIILLNQGIYIASLCFGLPIIIDFKKQPNLNIARNQINAECPIYIQGRKELYSFVFKALLRGEAWAKKASDIIASGIDGSLSQFDEEFFKSISKDEDKIAFAKIYQVFMLSLNGVEKTTLWDALAYTKNNKVYVNSKRQNHNMAQKFFSSIIKEMEDYFSHNKPVADKLLLDLKGVLTKDTFTCQLSCFNWLDLAKKTDLFSDENIYDHAFYHNTYYLNSDTVYRIQTETKPKKTPQNESVQILEVLGKTGIKFDVSKAWVAKNHEARQIFEEGLASIQSGLREIILETCESIPENIEIYNNPKIKPFFVRYLNCSTVDSRVYNIDGQFYLIITEEAFAQGAWMSKYLSHLLNVIDKSEDHVYEHLKFNNAFHDNVRGKIIASVYESMNEVAINASAKLIKKPMREGRKQPMKTMISSWGAIFEGIDGLLDNSEVQSAWKSLNNINCG